MADQVMRPCRSLRLPISDPREQKAIEELVKAKQGHGTHKFISKAQLDKFEHASVEINGMKRQAYDVKGTVMVYYGGGIGTFSYGKMPKAPECSGG